MRDEIILQLIKSPVLEDIIIACNHLIIKDKEKIIEFFERYSTSKLQSNTTIKVLTKNIIHTGLVTTLYTEYPYVIRDNMIIYMQRSLYLLDAEFYNQHNQHWKNVTI